MANTTVDIMNKPLDVLFSKVKYELLSSIESISKKYEVPSTIMTSLLKSIVLEADNNTLMSILGRYEILDSNELQNLVDNQNKTKTPENKSDGKTETSVGKNDKRNEK
jgi:hypothetical protein